jgi:hypothetical protein
MMATAMDADTVKVQLLPIILEMASDVVRFVFYYRSSYVAASQFNY